MVLLLLLFTNKLTKLPCVQAVTTSTKRVLQVDENLPQVESAAIAKLEGQHSAQNEEVMKRTLIKEQSLFIHNSPVRTYNYVHPTCCMVGWWGGDRGG